MSSSAANRYREVRLQTSTPGELLLALYDGLFRFLNGAKICIENKQLARARELLGKAYSIIAELYLALDFKVAEALCQNLASLYDFCMDRINDTIRTCSTQSIDDVLRVLTPLREAWQQAVPEAIMEANAKATAQK